MTLFGKIWGDTEIKSSAAKFHEVFSGRPHHISNITPEKVQGCLLHEGAFGSAGSTITWSYFHDGKAKKAKQVIEEVDDEKNSTTLRQIEGDLMEEYKSFIITVSATPKANGGSVVRWTLEYEKLNKDVPDPKTLLEYFDLVTKDIDAHLQVQA